MKRFFMLVLALVMVLGVSMAWGTSEVCLEWDPNTEQDIEKYNIYQSPDAFVPGEQPDPALKVDEVGHPINTKILIVEDGEWFWVVTALDTFDNESEASNPVTRVLDTEPPAPPQNLRFAWVRKIIAWLISFICPRA